MTSNQLEPALRQLRRMAGAKENEDASDRELLGRFVALQEEQAFVALQRRHGPMVLHVCGRLLGNAHDAEDVYQATFLLLARKAGSIRKQESVAGWLYCVARRLAVKAIAQQARRQAREKRAADRGRTSGVPDKAWQQLQTALEEALKQLPDKHRAVLLLCYLEGKTHDEAARQLGCPLGTVRSRLARGRIQLKELLERRGVRLSAVALAAALAVSESPAAVSYTLLDATARVALAYAAGIAPTALNSTRVAVLVDGGFNAMTTAKLKIAAIALLLLAGGLAFTAAALSSRTLAGPPQASAADGSSAQRKSADSPAAPGRPAAQETHDFTLRGQVLDGDGQPLLGAKLLVWTNALKRHSDMRVRASTGKDGRFHLRVTEAEIEQDAKILATAKGFGPDWADLKEATDTEVTLQLAKDDVPINGRIVDLEGHPVAGATIEVAGLDQNRDGDLKAWFKARGARYAVEMKHIGGTAVEGPVTATTGKDGRFRLSGFGRGRVVSLDIKGPNIENGFIYVVTTTQNVPSERTSVLGVFPPTFDYVPGPSRPIIGTIREQGTGKPLAGVRVASVGRIWAFATTDAQGRYRIEGAAKDAHYYVEATRIPYFWNRQVLADPGGTGPLTVDFEMVRGMSFKVRLTNKTTGRPVKCELTYLPLADNPTVGSGILYPDQGEVGPDGSFPIVLRPGPALLGVRAIDADQFVRSARRQDWNIPGSPPIYEQWHAVVPINPSEKDPKSLSCDIQLQPGRSREALVVGPDGQPLVGARVAGRWSVIDKYLELRQESESARFTVSGLALDRSRIVVFLHPAQKLGKVQPFKGDDKRPVTVGLEPLGALTGRIVGADSKPRAGLKVRTQLNVDKDLPVELLFSAWLKLTGCEAITNREGRFRLEGLLCGLEHSLNVSEGEKVLPAYSREGLIAESGKLKDLGDLKDVP
jgi:RNA polymerase sigma factor (sigma-70 family)